MSKSIRKILVNFILLPILIIAALWTPYSLVKEFFDTSPKITTHDISQVILDIGELSTIELRNSTVIKYTEGLIPFINKKEFGIIYHSIVKVGIELSEVEIEIKDQQVLVYIPDAKVMSVDIDPSQIEIVDEKFTLFNRNARQDTIKAFALAREKETEKGMDPEILKNAQLNAKKLLSSLLTPLIKAKDSKMEIIFILS